MTLQLPPQAGQARDDAIVARVVAGNYDELTWQAITSEAGGHTATFYVMADALKLDGVRVNVSAYALQEIADALGCLLLTPKLCDLMWLQRKATLLPQLTPIVSDTASMIRMSGVVDAAMVALDNQFVGLVQKTWCIDNDLLTHGGRAENYGFFVQPTSGTSWKGIGTEACVYAPSPANRVIQGRGWAHDPRHADYCLAPGTRVLTTDLRWVPIETVEVGDELVGFDEVMGVDCALRGARVQSTSCLIEECYEIVTSKTTVVASAAHRWPVKDGEVRVSRVCPKNAAKGWRGTRNKVTGWVPTSRLKPGDRIRYFCQPWEQDRSWDGAWMAGFLDGEGWLSGATFGFGQNPGALLDRAIEICSRNGLATKGWPNKFGCMSMHVLGARGPLRAVGTFRPLRLMAKSRDAWEGRRAYGGGGGRLREDDVTAEVLQVRPVGRRSVIGVGTSTGTFIAEGLLSHNSQLGQLAHRGCVVDGNNRDLADVLRDPALASLASHQGALRVLRQPGVPISRCPVKAVGTGAGEGGDSVCELHGLRPPTQGRPVWPYVAAAGIVGAGGYIAWRVYKKRKRR